MLVVGTCTIILFRVIHPKFVLTTTCPILEVRGTWFGYKYGPSDMKMAKWWSSGVVEDFVLQFFGEPGPVGQRLD